MRRRARRYAVGAVVAAILLAFVGVVVLHGIGFLNAYRIPAASMEPTLHCASPAPGCEAGSSDRVLVRRYLRGGPERGDIVAYRTPPAAEVRCGAGGTFVHRVVAVGGETFEERTGVVFVDGRRLDEPYVRPELRDVRTLPPRTVPAGSYVVLGDNRSAACDSRVWGTVPRRNVIGKVFARYWPPSRAGRP